MYIPSITTILGGIFLAYIGHSMWSIAQLFTNLQCTATPCYKSYLSGGPRLQMALFTSVTSNPISSEATKILGVKKFNYLDEYRRDIEVDIPLKTRRNGTLYMQIVIALDSALPLDWKSLKRDGPTVIHTVPLTDFIIPKAATFNLLGDTPQNDSQSKPKTSNAKPVAHFLSKAKIVMLTDGITVSHMDIPPELAQLIRVNKNGQFLPIIQADFFETRIRDLVEITKKSTEMTLQFEYSPIGIGKLRLMLLVEHATKSLKVLGFSKKDIDEVKGIFSDTNVYLLCGTVFVGSVHILFDFLSFKNDVIFWKQKKTYAGLSTRTILWRAFSQILVFLYLLDENSSLLVLIPAGIGALIEIWKCKKILKIEVTLRGIRRNQSPDAANTLKAEEQTQAVDREAMRYLSYLLYPLCIGGAIYSLLYQPHKSWYSWTINSLVNGVYAFGFLFMLPQLFINYKLKSVAALPWKAFMYKAFNTFIDDIFAFIITMPTAHRVACFRDDLIFIIYLYQRWLYPVDQTRIDTGGAIEATLDETATEEDKKTK